MQAIKITIGRMDRDKKIDHFLSDRYPELPRSYIYRIIKSGEVRVNSGRVQAVYRLKVGDEVRIPPLRPPKEKPIPTCPFPLIFEDDSILAIDKPAGIPVQPGRGVKKSVSELMSKYNKDYELVHRLDSDTSGLLLFAKNKDVFNKMVEIFEKHSIYKEYIVGVKSPWKYGEKFSAKFPLEREKNASGQIRVKVSAKGQKAHTDFILLEKKNDVQLLKAIIHTGRTHQIRVHAAHLGSAVAGDAVYGDYQWNKSLLSRGLKRMFLHAHRLEFPANGSVAQRAPSPKTIRSRWRQSRQ
jgi:23S rRNA pseudouridine955/2504/2580 synthase